MAVVSRITTIVITNAVGGTRTFTATAATQDTAAGSSVVVTIAQVAAGTTPPGEPDGDYVIHYRIDNGATEIKNATLNSTSASQANTYFFTDTGNTGGTSRAGTIRMRLRCRRQTGGPTEVYDVNSDDATGQVLPTGWSVTTRDQGWIRGTTTATVKCNITSFVAAAFTGTYAYPDTVFMRTTLGARAYDLTKTITNRIPHATGNVDSAVDDNVSTAGDANYDSTLTQAIDTRFTEAETSRIATVGTVQNATLTGQGWTSLTTINTQTLTVDPRVTLSSLTNSDSGGVAHVYNRGNTATGSLSVANARGVGFTPKGHHTLKSIDSGTSGVESTMVSNQTSAATKSWSFAYPSSGNVAAATSAGSEKVVRWRDTTTSGGTTNSTDSPQPALTSGYGFLSSLYDFAVHMQISSPDLDPNLNTDERQTQEIGYIFCKITDRNGNAVNGAIGEFSLRDDADAVTVFLSGSQTTASVNGNDGYTTALQWTASLPAGGWDVWDSDTFEKDGNATPGTRKGTGSFDITLIAKDPLITVQIQGGTLTTPGDHVVTGDTVTVGAALVRLNAKIEPTVASGVVSLVRFNPSLGTTEYLDSDESTWTTGDTLYQHAMAASAGDSKVLLKSFDTTDWNTQDVTTLVEVENNGVKYFGSDKVIMVGKSNKHGGNAFDPTGLFQ